jgi:hypothetical protein
MFFRRKIIDEHGFFFGAEWKALGDAAWMLRLLDAGIPMGLMRRFLAVFADTGANLSLSDNGRREQRAMFDSAPWRARKFAFALVARHRLSRLIGGLYFQKPFDYAFYTAASPGERVVRHVSRPASLWRSRL